MRLICPNCDAQYEVDDGAIPQGGRDVQCSNCGHAWFQMHLDLDEDEELGIAPPVAAEPEPAPAPAPARQPEPDVAEAPTGQDVAPAAAPAPPEPPPPAPGGPVRRTLDDNLLSVLREEAAREAAERRAEAARSIETQADLGALEPAPRSPVATAEAPASSTEPDHPITQRPNARRDLLPDIEEINSTLRPGSEARDEAEAALDAAPPKRAAFRTGFFSVLLIAVVLVILYVMAPQLGARFPSASATLTAYVTTVDALRVWLDGLMQSAAGGLRGLTGEG